MNTNWRHQITNVSKKSPKISFDYQSMSCSLIPTFGQNESIISLPFQLCSPFYECVCVCVFAVCALVCVFVIVLKKLSVTYSTFQH